MGSLGNGAEAPHESLRKCRLELGPAMGKHVDNDRAFDQPYYSRRTRRWRKPFIWGQAALTKEMSER